MFQINRGGCTTRHPSTFITSRPEGSSDYMLLIIKTPGNFTVFNVSYKVQPGTAIIFAPNVPYFYQNPDGEYIDDWLHFDISGDSSLPFRELTLNTFFSVKNIDIFTFYIRQLLWEKFYSNASIRQENIDYLMHILLNHLLISYQQSNNTNSYNPYSSKLQNIRITMQSTIAHPLTADDCGRNLGVSKSHFQHIYSQYFGIPFQKDYIQMRIDYAKDLLETSDLKLEQIAEYCGYSSEVHFYRQFKSIMEMTPAEYRRKYRNLSFH